MMRTADSFGGCAFLSDRRGVGPLQFAWAQCGPVRTRRVEAERQQMSLLALFVVTALAVCCVTMFLLVVGAHRSPISFLFDGGAAETYRSEWPYPASKEKVLARLSIEQQQQLASHTHFISDIIRQRGREISQSDKRLALSIVYESFRSNYDPLLVAAVILAESTFNHKAVSHRGAQGLMQIMPTTGKYISARNSLGWAGERGLRDPAYNVKLGIAYLKHLESLFNGNREKALIAYNWGPGNLSKAIKTRTPVPRSTIVYARKILDNHSKWRRHFDSSMAQYKYLSLDSVIG